MVINAAGDLFIKWLETRGDGDLPCIHFSRSIGSADDANKDDSNTVVMMLQPVVVF